LGDIIQAGVSYRTALGTYIAFASGNQIRAVRLGAANPPTLATVWTVAEGGFNCSPWVTSTDGTNNVIVWCYGSEGDQKLRAFNGDTGAAIFTGSAANQIMASTHHLSTAIAARGRIYVAADNKVYAFSAPGQTVNTISIAQSNVAVLPGGGFQFAFTNVPGALFNVFASTDVNAAFTNWAWLGSPNEASPGHFQFTDTNANTARFYRVVSP
jgi:outer membrane protein assembly factor BamB